MGLTIFMCNKFFLLKANTLATAFIVPKKYVVSGRIVLLVKQLKAGEFIMVHLSAALLFVIMLVIMYVSGKNRKKLAGNALIVKRITDSINLGIVTTVWNREQNIIYANDCFYEMVGYTRDEFYKEYANSLTELVARSNGGHVIEELYGKLASGEKIVLEFYRENHPLKRRKKGNHHIKQLLNCFFGLYDLRVK